MASDSPGLDVLVRAILDAKGFEDLKVQLKKAADEAGDAKKPTDEFTNSIVSMGKQLLVATGALVGIHEALAFGKEAFNDYVEAGRAIAQLDAVNAAYGESTKEATEANHEWIDSLELASGIAETRLVPAYMKLIEVTGDVEQAQALTQIATGGAARGFGDVADNATVLARFLLHPEGPIRGTTAFALELKKLQTEGVSTAEIMKRLSKEYGDGGATVHNVGVEVDRNREIWKNFKEAMGAIGESLITTVRPAMEVVGLAIATLVAGIQKFIGFTLAAASGVAGLFKAVLELARGNVAGAVLAVQEGEKAAAATYDEWNKKADETVSRVVDTFNRSTGALKSQRDVELAAEEAANKARKLKHEELMKFWQMQVDAAKLAASSEIAALESVAAVYHRMSLDGRLADSDRVAAALKEKETLKELATKELEELRKKYRSVADAAVAEGGSAEDVARRLIDVYRDELAAIAALGRQDAETTALRSETAKKLAGEFRKWTDERIKEIADEDKARKTAEDRELAEVVKLNDRKLKLQETAAKDSSHLQSEQLKNVIAVYQQDLDSFVFTTEEKEKIEEKLAEARLRLNKAVVDEEIAGRQAVAGAAKELISTMFGDSKEAAVASALINTYEGVTKALSLAPPYSYILAALTLAMGLAQVQKINETDVGSSSSSSTSTKTSGFDDPINDFAVVAGGRKWANDQIALWDEGVRAGFRGGMRDYAGAPRSTTSISNDNRRSSDSHNVVNLHASFLDTASDVQMRNLAKVLHPYLGRLDSRRNLG